MIENPVLIANVLFFLNIVVAMLLWRKQNAFMKKQNALLKIRSERKRYGKTQIVY